MSTPRGLVDEGIREYLVFRGFTASLRAFESDLRADKVCMLLLQRPLFRTHFVGV
jgi:hypothetical protein